MIEIKEKMKEETKLNIAALVVQTGGIALAFSIIGGIVPVSIPALLAIGTSYVAGKYFRSKATKAADDELFKKEIFSLEEKNKFQIRSKQKNKEEASKEYIKTEPDKGEIKGNKPTARTNIGKETSIAVLKRKANRR